MFVQQAHYLHDWGAKAIDYERYRPLLEKAGAITPLAFADAKAYLLDAAKTYAVIRENFRRLRETE